MSNFGQEENIVKQAMSHLGKRSSKKQKTKDWGPGGYSAEMKRRGQKGLAKRWGKGNNRSDERSETT